MTTSTNKEVKDTSTGVAQDPTSIDKSVRGGRGSGLRPGQGRPKGTTTIYSKESVKKLQSLGFDPIEKLVDHYYRVQDKINAMESGETRYSAVALANLLNIQTSVMNTLMRYGYRQVPEKSEQVIEDKKPLKIVFTNE
jgi:hypothetical protein